MLTSRTAGHARCQLHCQAAVSGGRSLATQAGANSSLERSDRTVADQHNTVACIIHGWWRDCACDKRRKTAQRANCFRQHADGKHSSERRCSARYFGIESIIASNTTDSSLATHPVRATVPLPTAQCQDLSPHGSAVIRGLKHGKDSTHFFQSPVGLRTTDLLPGADCVAAGHEISCWHCKLADK